MLETKIEGFSIRPALEEDLELVLYFIKELAKYEKLSDDVTANVEILKNNIFKNKYAEVLLCFFKEEPVGFAIFFHNFSTFIGKPGLYLEDLFIKPEFRGKGFGGVTLSYLAKLAVERDCGRFEWVVLDWNKPAIDFYTSIGAQQRKEWIINRVSGDELNKLAEKY